MEKRRLGRTDLMIAPLVFGGNVFGWTADEATSFALLDRFVDGGLNAIDTADVYSRWAPGNQGGESEAILGRWLKRRGRHDDLVIVTKVGSEMGPGLKGLSAAYIETAVEASLRRLGVEAIDLYLSHWPDPATPHEETLAAYTRLIEKGKIRWAGASNLDAGQLGDALAASEAGGLTRYEVLQPEYNLYDRAGLEGPLIDLCQREEVGVISYFGLARGFLTGKYRSADDLGQSPRGEGIGRYLNDRGFRLLDALDTGAAAPGARPAEVALAWVIARPGVTAPIASATTPAQADSLVRAATLALGADEIALLTAAGA